MLAEVFAYRLLWCKSGLTAASSASLDGFLMLAAWLSWNNQAADAPQLDMHRERRPNLRVQTLHGGNDALREAVHEDVADVVHICLPCWSALADFEGAIAVGQQLGHLQQSRHSQPVQDLKTAAELYTHERLYTSLHGVKLSCG